MCRIMNWSHHYLLFKSKIYFYVSWIMKAYKPLVKWVQCSAVIKQSNIVRYCINNYRNWGRISTRCWIHIPCPNGRAMGCLLWLFMRRLTVLWRHRTVLLEPGLAQQACSTFQELCTWFALCCVLFCLGTCHFCPIFQDNFTASGSIFYGCSIPVEYSWRILVHKLPELTLTYCQIVL